MFRQLLVSAVNLVNIAVHSIAMAGVVFVFKRRQAAQDSLRFQVHLILLMIAVVLVLNVAHLVEVAIWALLYSLLGVVPSHVSPSSRRTPVVRAACLLAALWIGAGSAQAETIAQLVSREEGVDFGPCVLEPPPRSSLCRSDAALSRSLVICAWGAFWEEPNTLELTSTVRPRNVGRDAFVPERNVQDLRATAPHTAGAHAGGSWPGRKRPRGGGHEQRCVWSSQMPKRAMRLRIMSPKSV